MVATLGTLTATANASSQYYCYGESTSNYAITYVYGCKARHYIVGQYRSNPSEDYTSVGPWAPWGIQSCASQAEIVLVKQHWGVYTEI